MICKKPEFKLDPLRTAIVVNDLQVSNNSYPGAPLPRPTMTSNILRLLAAGRAAGAQLILVHSGGAPDGVDRPKPTADSPFKPLAPLPPDWSELIPELNRQPEDIVILKRQWGAFYGTDLDLQLRRRGLKTIVSCGIATEIGVESTARDAFERGYELVFASDAMTGIDAECHTNSIERIFPRIGRVRTTDEVIFALEP
jgi:nicotinamidase-related amidase